MASPARLARAKPLAALVADTMIGAARLPRSLRAEMEPTPPMVVEAPALEREMAVALRIARASLLPTTVLAVVPLPIRAAAVMVPSAAMVAVSDGPRLRIPTTSTRVLASAKSLLAELPVVVAAT